MESFSQVQESDLKFMNVKTGHMRAILIRLNPNPAPKGSQQKFCPKY